MTIRIISLIFILMCALNTFSFYVTGGSNGATIVVDDDNGSWADYHIIQEALDNATENDTIRVYEGYYLENVFVRNSVNLIGNGSDNTTINGTRKGDAIRILADDVTFTGFNVEHNYTFVHKGINVKSNNSIISQNVVSKTTYGIRVQGSNNTILNNDCFVNVVGIHLINATLNIINNNNLTGNNWGMGIDWSNNNNVTYNSICDSLDGIWVHQSNNNSFMNNTSSLHEQNGVNLIDSQNTLFVGNNVSNNPQFGIVISNSDFSIISSNEIFHNGIGIYIRDSNNMNIMFNQVLNNTDRGIFLYNSTKNAVLSNNCSNNPTGIVLSKSDDNDIINNTIVCNNNGVYLFQCNKTDLEGNLLLHNTNGFDLNYSSNNSISNNTFSDNQCSLVFHHMSDSNIIWYNEINGGETGILLTDSSQKNTAHFNRITDTGTWGIDSSNNEEMRINATSNWWGNPSGPYCTHENPDGTGENVSLYVDFEPWLPYAEIQGIEPNPANDSDEITFVGKCYVFFDVGVYLWYSDIDGELYRGTNSSFSSSELTNGTHNITFRIWDTTLGWSEPANLTVVVNGRPRADIVSINPVLVPEGSTVTFTGNGTDDGTIEEYSWHSSIDGVIYSGANSTFARSDLSNGTHNISLTVRDDLGSWSEPVSTEFLVNGIPLAFIESIAPDFASEGDTVFFKGGHFDDGKVLLYQWFSNLDGELYNATNSSFSTSELSNGTHNISYSVCDDLGIWSAPVKSQVTINGVPRAYITSTYTEFIIHGLNVYFTCNSIDDGIVVRYVWNSTHNGVLYDGEGKSFVTSDLVNGTHIISLVVQDNVGTWSYTDTIVINVTGIPIAMIVSITPYIPLQGSNVTFVGNGVDDNAIIRYVWTSTIDGQLYNGTSSSFVSDSLSNGTHEIRLKVQDEWGIWSKEIYDTLNVSGRPIVAIITVSPNPALATSSIELIGMGIDDNNITQYQWVSSIDGTLYSGTDVNYSATDLSSGNHTIILRARDSFGFWSRNDTTYLIINMRPTVQMINPEFNSTVSGIIRINGTSTDVDGVIESVELSINNGSWQLVSGTSEWHFEWDTTTETNGMTSICVRSYDGMHYSLIEEVIVDLDNQSDDTDDDGQILILGIVIGLIVLVIAIVIYMKKFR